MKREMFLYPWDVLDEGAQPLAERLAALGVETVALALVYHSGKLLLPHDPRRRVLLHRSSRSYFPFTAERYGRLKPRQGELLDGSPAAFLNSVLAAFHSVGIRVCAWVVVFHAGRLARRNPDCAEWNAWDEPSPHSLCPSNEEVFAYGLTLLEEIAAAGVDGLYLESVDYAGFLHGAHHEMQAYADTARLDRLLGQCFCPACVKRAEQVGIDVPALRRQVKLQAERLFALEPAGEETLPWQPWDALRAQRIAEFYTELRRRLRARGLSPEIKPILWLAGGADPRGTGVDPTLLAPVVDGMIAAYPDSPQQVADFAARARSLAPAGMPLTGGVRLMAPHTVQPQQVPDYWEAYRAQGAESVIFYNYGMAPLPFLQALREEKR